MILCYNEFSSFIVLFDYKYGDRTHAPGHLHNMKLLGLNIHGTYSSRAPSMTIHTKVNSLVDTKFI